jgi:hypothetical protein
MTDLHDAGDARHGAQIDGVGWVFAAVVVIITAIAGIMAYHSSGGVMVAGKPLSHVAASR